MPGTAHPVVTAPVHFIKWIPLYEHEKPFNIFINLPKGAEDARTNNLEFDIMQTTFQDIRGRESEFSLDEHGFEYLKYSDDFANFHDRDAVETIYLPRLEQLMREHVSDTEEIAMFEWRLRDSKPMKPGELRDLEDPTDKLRPSLHPHIDHGLKPILKRIQAMFPNDYERLLKKRVRVINFWRPINHKVEDWPLAMADGSQITLDDFIETDHVRRKYKGASLNLQYRPGYHWHYLGGQDTNEVILFKNFDSSDQVRARFAPHVSFPHPSAKKGAVRESFEVRMLIFSSK